MTEWHPQLPGIKLPEYGQGHIGASARATLARLEAQGLLQPEHALTAQLVLGLSTAIDRGLGYGRVTVATTTLVKELRELIGTLPAPAEVPGGGDGWDELQAWLAAQDGAQPGAQA